MLASLVAAPARRTPALAGLCLRTRSPGLVSNASIARALATTASTDKSKSKGTAVLLMNMGGPETLDMVEPFLTSLFSDPDLIPIPFQSRLAPLIARNRTPKIQDQYAAIGGGSPIRMWTEKQAEGMRALLDAERPASAPHVPFVAFRYVPPSTDSAVRAIVDQGFDRAVAFTQYPQYSCSTTGSSLNELYRQIQAHDPTHKVHWSVVDRWATHPGLVKAFAERIQESLAQYPESVRDSVVLVFSAHSLPMTVVNRGDPYVHEVAATVHAVMQSLGVHNPYRLAWQSKVGPREWMGPQTADVLEALGKKGQENALLVPIAFTSDHIETLYELDAEYMEEARSKWGMQGVRRAESLNASPTFIRAMADVMRTHLDAGGKPASVGMLGMQCPMCTKESCRQAKDFFVGELSRSSK